MDPVSRGARRILPAALFGGIAALAGCHTASEPAATPQAAAATQVPGDVQALLARQPMANVYSAGQPDADAWPRLAAAGIGTVIDLRPDAERPGRDEGAEVQAVGLAYRQIPVAGPQDLTPEAARTLWQAIEAAPGKVLVHCASGNRVGALLAIAAAREGGMAPEQALELGRGAGMTSLEPRVREVLGLPAAGDP
ncbi:MAG: protein tyrosine phosphatase family protein [Luteimonas sp.]|nr:protein tyrosine phosphatase family protein [Luteimonas sp.]